MKKIVVGITGSIAAYKTAYLIRLLKKSGYEVRVVMTKGATAFVTPLTFQALTGNSVVYDILDPQHEKGMGHIELARWADYVLIAPCTANTLSKIALGLADNLLTALVLATETPLLIAPSMNRAMWGQKIIQSHVLMLKERGIYIIGPDEGEQACGELGEGRMASPEEIFYNIDTYNNRDQSLKGKKVVITGGPTIELIDPVRFISNFSSGKMAYALAEAFFLKGADVTLISGPTNLSSPFGVKQININTAEELLEASLEESKDADIFVGAAAVCDFKVEHIATNKIKKQQGTRGLKLDLVENPDILSSVMKANPKLYGVGFAAETQDIEENGQKKLRQKGLNVVCINDVKSDVVFGADNNAIILLDKNGIKLKFEKSSKKQISEEIVKYISSNLSVS